MKVKDMTVKYQGWYFILLLIISFSFFALPYLIHQTFSWTDHWLGFNNGIFHVLLFGMIWCFLFLPYSLVVYGFYRWKKWRRFLALWIVGPMLLFFLNNISLIFHLPPSPHKRFQHFTKVEMPVDIQNLHYSFSGGGFADYSDTYYFKCRAKDTEKLIKEFKFKNFKIIDKRFIHYSVRSLPGCPEYKNWFGGKMYKRIDDTWFFYLVTDKTETEVYILVGCI